MFGDGAESVSRRYVPAPGRDRPARSVRLAGMLARVIQLLLATASAGTAARGCAVKVGSVVVSSMHAASKNALSASALG